MGVKGVNERRGGMQREKKLGKKKRGRGSRRKRQEQSVRLKRGWGEGRDAQLLTGRGERRMEEEAKRDCGGGWMCPFLEMGTWSFYNTAPHPTPGLIRGLLSGSQR